MKNIAKKAPKRKKKRKKAIHIKNQQHFSQ